MKLFHTLSPMVVIVSLAAAKALAADAPDVTSLYEVSTDGTSQKVKLGEAGKLVLAIKTKQGAHISDEAPLRIELSGSNVKPEKAKLSKADSVAQKADGQKFVDPRFEVPFMVEAAGKGQLDAKMTFFVCTEQICARQQKSISLPVEVVSGDKKSPTVPPAKG
jgi:hypothetical protein